MSLNRLFRLISIALLLLFLAFAVSLVWTEWNSYRNGANSVPALRTFRLALVALEKLSAERGPANAFMGASASQREAVADKLKNARAETDAALAALRQALQSHPRLRQSWSLDKVKTVQQALEPARAAIDRIGRQPEAERNNVYVLSAVGGMVDMIPLMIRVASELSSEVDHADPELREGLAAIRAAASLREYAGQVGSRFTPALIAHRKLTQDEVIEIGRLYGRIELLRGLLNTQMASYVQRPEFARALELVDKQYFDNGFQFLDFLLQTGVASGDYGLTSVDLFRFYVPQMKSITDLRDLLLDDMMEQAERHNRRARNYLLLVIAVTVVACLFFQVLMVLIRRRVVQPLVLATDLVSGLVEGRLDQEIPQPRYEDEISAMMRALKVLRQRMRERNSLAREREALITQLQTSSNTDFLTGVLNRRAFFTHGQQQMTVAKRYGRELAVVLFDIDHFKQINDSYGHQAGDAILRGVAQSVSQLLRKVDVLARYGGEEFIILLPESSLLQAAAASEKLRAALAAGEFEIDGGRRIRVTASFGVAAENGGPGLEHLIKQADIALYRAKKLGRNRVELAGEEEGVEGAGT
ncbi:diguanylate cyclase [Herbaspirillum seropedicae]|uniref:diguanylate cyclase n=1 Tax=Herbaspirillum seropedicae (strain SmR1) TaxID=757424 RepID=D8IS77_HERSS|nr:GGDEF domain-containing protein [Herbaspirillum seropedicae]ADJ63421.1 GGDEF domain containing protein [Herbaspirillum seropedicae SmR1]AKN65455.1 diguanylate cyclase [Herbaspirillum seropedicae]NQE28616.1 diguanylate cyclase [Herbaspirillum seropedicae]UMU21424.1 diguanylate cyclase [Herbaspirillum seropedicae]